MQYIVDIIALSAMGGISFCYLAYLFEFKEKEQNLLSCVGAVIGLIIGTILFYHSIK